MSCWNEAMLISLILKGINLMSFKASSTLFLYLLYAGRIRCLILQIQNDAEGLSSAFEMSHHQYIFPVLFFSPMLSLFFYNSDCETVFEMTAWVVTKKKVLDGNFSCTYVVPFLQCHKKPFTIIYTNQECFIQYWTTVKKSVSISRTPCLIWKF